MGTIRVIDSNDTVPPATFNDAVTAADKLVFLFKVVILDEVLLYSNELLTGLLG